MMETGETLLWEKGGSEGPMTPRSMTSLWLFVLLKLLQLFSAYRQERLVEELMVFSNGEGYYVCPRCRITLARDFVSYCDRCGQHLGWSGYKNVRIIYPGRQNERST